MKSKLNSMKKIILYAFTLSLLCTALIGIQSCNDDDPAPNILVVAERTTGKLFKLDPSTGARTEVGQIKDAGGDGLTNIRGMVYHSASKRIFISSTSDGGGSIYVADSKAKVASIFHEDVDDLVYGGADLLITTDNKVVATLWFTDDASVGYGSGFLLMPTSGAEADSVRFSEDLCCGMGICFGSSNNEILVASDDIEIFSSTLDGTVTLEASLTPVGFPTEAPDDYAILNMVKVGSDILALVYDYEEGDTYLAKVNLVDEELTVIGQVNDAANTTRYHGLMLIPSDRL